MLAHSQHTYWQLHEALELEALVAEKGPVINIKLPCDPQSKQKNLFTAKLLRSMVAANVFNYEKWSGSKFTRHKL
jgi:hypothetical protein